MKLLFGTINQGKLNSMKRLMLPLQVEIIGLDELGRPVPAVDETGRDPLENAVLKATAFYAAFRTPVFSCDSGLYFDGLDPSLQPGTHVRRVNGKVLTDEEMIAYYAGLASSRKAPLAGRYRNAICLVMDEAHVFKSMDDSLATAPFLLTSEPHPKRVEGYPLDSLSLEPKTLRYYYDLPDYSVDQGSDNGFKSFFLRCFAQMQAGSLR